MPPSDNDSETASLYKQLLLRPTQVEIPHEITGASSSAQESAVDAFAKYCEYPQTKQPVPPLPKQGATCFTTNWLEYAKHQQELADEGYELFWQRYQWPSLVAIQK